MNWVFYKNGDVDLKDILMIDDSRTIVSSDAFLILMRYLASTNYEVKARVN